MTKEWEFDEESETVDLDRLHNELSNIPATVANSYLKDLASKAPIVYRRYRDREKVRRGEHQIWNWGIFDNYIKGEEK